MLSKYIVLYSELAKALFLLFIGVLAEQLACRFLVLTGRFMSD
ncbi:hypothetical protein HMPREF1991_02883 [Hoylesella loescheii DSM 19665 = JCM 12249 = ATCC 15930]|uniref:Uncharacterized protein n=1 Tax=Hoylesella loescheii DSM 19665 = JCM 12249 = ATCC 15930 TaxID=1122985 RepID=A0A069QE24_HOYLO|nr:hypothetical protein HMPREF1991_02883 [Hoylesella loescheii DSM 19665 = JCM 12249 = ATCC 15930]